MDDQYDGRARPLYSKARVDHQMVTLLLAAAF
jgi:hypothetical protein